MLNRSLAWLGGTALALALGVGNGWSQTVSLAERRTITVNGQSKTIVSKLSKLNPNTTRVRGGDEPELHL